MVFGQRCVRTTVEATTQVNEVAAFGEALNALSGEAFCHEIPSGKNAFVQSYHRVFIKGMSFGHEEDPGIAG
jgi:hypothetical protein